METEIVQARITAKSFSQFNQAELKTLADQIIVRCSSACGCNMPNTDFFAGIISEELIFFISKRGYSDLTYQEIMLAIRYNTHGELNYPESLEISHVIFTGNHFNIEYFSKLLKNYFTMRTFLDRKFQNFIDGYIQ